MIDVSSRIHVFTGIDGDTVFTDLMVDGSIVEDECQTILEMVRDYLAKNPNQADAGELMNQLREAAEECWDYLYDIAEDDDDASTEEIL